MFRLEDRIQRHSITEWMDIKNMRRNNVIMRLVIHYT